MRPKWYITFYQLVSDNFQNIFLKEILNFWVVIARFVANVDCLFVSHIKCTFIFSSLLFLRVVI